MLINWMQSMIKQLRISPIKTGECKKMIIPNLVKFQHSQNGKLGENTNISSFATGNWENGGEPKLVQWNWNVKS